MDPVGGGTEGNGCKKKSVATIQKHFVIFLGRFCVCSWGDKIDQICREGRRWLWDEMCTIG